MGGQDFQERTEQATPKRREEARKKGQVPRSRELNTLLSLLGAATGLLVLGGGFFRGLLALFEHGLGSPALDWQQPDQVARIMAEGLGDALLLLMPLFLVLLVTAFAGPLLMGGMVFSWQAVMPNAEKLNPLKGLKRIFSLQGGIELVKALAKFAVVAGVAVLLMWFLGDDFLQLGVESLTGSMAHAGWLLGWSFLGLSAVLALVAGIDVPFQIFHHNKQLRMTRQEVKDELKESDGRPEVKSRVRAIQREMSQRRMMAKVPEADVVITNPTHFAVALRYQEADAGAPVVVAKGRGFAALRIRDLAQQHGVTIFEAPPLARALYASTELEQEVPAELYLAVARVLAYVYRLKSFQPYREQPPEPPVDFDIPEDLQWNGHLDGGDNR